MKREDEQKTSLCFLEARDKFCAINEVVQRCSVFADLPNRDQFIARVVSREHLQSTGIGHGVAIAHGTVSQLNNVHIGLGISEAGLLYDSVDKKPVHLLFVIASSPALQLEYLTSLSTLLRLIRGEEVRSHLIDPNRWDSDVGVHTLLVMLQQQQFVHPVDQ